MSNYVGRIGPLKYSARGKWAYELAGFNKYGLYHNDCMDEMICSDVREAVRRLPRDLYDSRNFRIIRALHLSMTKQILPKNEWTKYEQDYRYLEPYLDEVISEREERELWGKHF